MRRLGEYELLRKIGSGGMAEVWMGRRAAMAGASKAVAIKLLARDLLDDPSYRQMFIDEARLSMLLTNSNVVQVFDVGESDGECYMVMEWVDGLNLSELTRKMQREGEGLSLVVVAHVIGEVLRALAYAHGLHHEGSKATIVHRDVSPQNVIASVSGEVKLADFGVARLAREETSGLHVKGKLRYMAPEQLRGRSRDPTVDLYAVGAILHELIAGERFRQTRDEAELYAMVLSGEYPPLAVDLPREIDELRRRLLEPDPRDRIQSADEALELLYGWPGFRNSSRELGKLICKWVGVRAPRSGIVSSDMLLSGGPSTASAATTVPAETRAADAAPSPTDDPGPSEVETAVESVHQESGPNEDRGVTQTRTWVSSAEHEGAPTSLISLSPQGRASASSMLIVAAVTLALSFGVFGLGFPLGWWGGGGEPAGDPAPPHADSEVTARSEPVPEPEPEPEPEVEPESEVVPDPTPHPTLAPADDQNTNLGAEAAKPAPPQPDAEPADTDGSQVAIAPEPEKETVVEPPKQPVDRTPADVQFIAGGFMYVWVKVGSTELLLEPNKSIELKPGRHRVSLRQTEDDEWAKAGSIKLEAGKRYRVRMQKPAGLKLEHL